MKHLISALAVAAGIAALAGCGHDENAQHTSPMYSAGGAVDVYYDNNYGPIYDGYWSGETFHFRTGADQAFQADTGGHIRKSPAPGFSEVRVEQHPAAPGAPGQPPQ